jgi:integrase
MTKREAQRLLQPYVDRANSSLSESAREHKSATFEAFSRIWERDYLCLSKPSTQATMRGHVKRLSRASGQKDMRQISTADFQRVIAAMDAEGYEPKTIRNRWATTRLVWDAAPAQGYIDRALPKPKLPRNSRKMPKYFRSDDVATIIAHSEKDIRAFFWLAAETGLRAGELAGIRIVDVDLDRIVVTQSVWHGSIQTPKTNNAVSTAAVSLQLGLLLSEQATASEQGDTNSCSPHSGANRRIQACFVNGN